MTEIVWEEPPPTPGRHAEFWAALRAHPKRWAVYPGTASGAYQNAQRHPGYEVTSRMVNEKPVAYARYVGEVEQ